MNSEKNSNLNEESTNHVDHELREDMRLRQPLSQQPLDSIDAVNTINNASNSSTIGAIVGSVQHNLSNVKDKIFAAGENIRDAIQNQFVSKEKESQTSSIGATDEISKKEQSELNKECKEFQKAEQIPLSSLLNIGNEQNTSDLYGVNLQQKQNVDIEKNLSSKKDESNIIAPDYIDHQFREDLRLRQPLSQQPLDETDISNTNATSNSTIGSIINSAQSSITNTKDKIMEVSQNLTQSIKEKITSSSSSSSSGPSSLNDENIQSKKIDEQSGPTVKEKVSTALENVKDSTSAVVSQLKEKTVGTLNVAGNKMLDAVHYVQEKANESMKPIDESQDISKPFDNEKSVNESENKDNSNIKHKIVDKAQDIKESVQNNVENVKDKASEKLNDLKENTQDKPSSVQSSEKSNNTFAESVKESAFNLIRTIQDKANASLEPDTSEINNEPSSDNNSKEVKDVDIRNDSINSANSMNLNNKDINKQDFDNKDINIDSNNKDINNKDFDKDINGIINSDVNNKVASDANVNDKNFNNNSNNNNNDKGTAVEILGKRISQPYEYTELMTETLPTSDNLLQNTSNIKDNNLNENNQLNL